jgi:16S rRNA (cytosine1402-N4)-methyltransferase
MEPQISKLTSTMPDAYHVPVLLEEVLLYLDPKPKGIIVDGTLGGGGHAERIFERSSPDGKVIGFDLDREALETAGRRLSHYRNRFVPVHSNVSRLMERLKEIGIECINGLVLDLGVSSHQLNEHTRGFSFQTSSRLDFRMDQTQTLDGWKVINTYPVERLTEIFREYGEERFSGRIARKIVGARETSTIDTTVALAGIVESAIGKAMLVKSLARIFQAIRIEVNNELENLSTALRDALDLLSPGGRVVVISYHSLEDRIVKHFFRDEAQNVIRSANKHLPDRPRIPRLKVLTKRPVLPTDEEIHRNPRARSAKLRAAEKV